MRQIDLNQLHRTRARLPILRDERTALTMREMDRILQKAAIKPVSFNLE